MSGSVPIILKRLESSIPSYETELRHEDPFQLLMATILSAQTTDERVNQVTPTLFQRYPDPAALAAVDSSELEERIHATGFFRQKAKALKACSQGLVELFGGRVPDSLEELVRLPGVGRKTANLILGQAFGKPAVVVDTHVRRVARRLGLTAEEKDATRIELDLRAQLPEPAWWSGSSRLLLHGRYVCTARKPRCAECVLSDLCPSAFRCG
ncbi:MAG: endonuclease III [Armatimonadetes bacterium]|nr:endonuclease III [Armatimonadota bacterium]